MRALRLRMSSGVGGLRGGEGGGVRGRGVGEGLVNTPDSDSIFT